MREDEAATALVETAQAMAHTAASAVAVVATATSIAATAATAEATIVAATVAAIVAVVAAIVAIATTTTSVATTAPAATTATAPTQAGGRQVDCCLPMQVATVESAGDQLQAAVGTRSASQEQAAEVEQMYLEIQQTTQRTGSNRQ